MGGRGGGGGGNGRLKLITAGNNRVLEKEWDTH